MLQPQLRVEAMLGTYHGAIGARHIISQGSSYVSRIQLEEVHVEEPLVVPLDGLHIDDKLYIIEENIEIRSQKVEAKLYPKLSRFVGTLGKELSIHGNMKTNSGRNIRIFSPNPYFHLVSQLEP
ncbi:hypothetical protein Tco_0432333 [Tanacetum coccineum]